MRYLALRSEGFFIDKSRNFQYIIMCIFMPISEHATNYQELRELKGLLDDGIISPQEFDAKKKELLNL